MPRYGGFSPYPLRYGGGESSGKTFLQRVFESLASQRGTAYDQTINSAVGVENMALARGVCFDGYGANQRLSNSFRPTTMTGATGMLNRWEKILNRAPLSTDSEVARRARLVSAFALIGKSNAHQPVVDAITASLGPVFLGTITYQTPATAVTYWPGGGNNTPSLPWYSTIDHILIGVTLPPGYLVSTGVPNNTFWNAVGSMVPILDSILPAWVTADWFLLNSHLTQGFYLDENDLDLEIFDV